MPDHLTSKMLDADGIQIAVGSVLQSLDSEVRGVVNWIGTEAGQYAPYAASIGDIAIQLSPSALRISNQYSNWRHIPRDKQSYAERVQSWEQQRNMFDDLEQTAVEGVLSLLPEDPGLHNYGPAAFNLAEALRMLANHLDTDH